MGEDKKHEIEELITRISSDIDRKKVQSLCKKILKKCSFNSSKDLTNIAELATWLYIYEYYDEMLEVCDLLKDMEFKGDYYIWNSPDLTMCLKSRVYREREMYAESRALIEKVNEHRAPELYENLVDGYRDLCDEEELKELPRSAAIYSRFCKLEEAVRYREAGQFPISDEELERDISEQLAILRNV